MSVEILCGDALAVLRTMPDESVQTCVTSPPYFGLRDYGVEGQAGLESSPEAYISGMVEVFREVRRVLKPDGTFWLNLGDSYARNPAKGSNGPGGKEYNFYGDAYGKARGAPIPSGLKEKDRMMMPARTALSLQADGWWLRDEIVWHKPRTTPAPVTDRTVAAHEMVYLLTKSPRYYYDWRAIEEPSKFAGAVVRYNAKTKNERMKAIDSIGGAKRPNGYDRDIVVRDTRRARSVWSINPQPYKEAHFAVMASALAERCIKAGSKPGDCVLDPFGGAGTTGLVSMRLGRKAVLIELNPEYCALARRRIDGEPGVLNAMARLRAAMVRNTEARRG